MNERSMYKLLPAANETSLWELKLSKKDSTPFSALPPHQEELLLRSKTSVGVWWKCPDMLGMHQLACDGFFIKEAKHAFVIVIFYIPRKPKVFYYIDIDDWIAERASSKRKSLTRERAKEIALYEKTAP